jgi:Fe-S cluster assembly protein SufD
MQQAVVEQDSVFRHELEQLLAQRPPEPHWLTQRRLAAIEQFEHLGVPHRRLEAWRNTDVSALMQRHYSVAPLPTHAVRADALGIKDAYRLVFVDGHLQPGGTALGGLPAGAQVTPLSMALYRDDPLLEEHLGRHFNVEHPFAALNTAFSTDGAVVHLKAGTVLEKPILLEFVCSEGVDHAAYPRVLVVAESGAEAQIIEHFRGPAEGAYFTCPVTELVIGENAGLSWYKLQEEGSDAFHIGCTVARLARDARLRGHSFASGARLSRTEIYVELEGEGADAELNGLYLTAEGQLSDHHTWVEHRVGHCSSRQRFKGILNGKSEAVYDGLVRVAHAAAKTDARQENRNLLLSKRALAHSNPRLEIYTDDVKCSHGSTVGELDRDALFYLRSRGIGQQDAQGLLTFAFAEEQLTPITIPALREYERERLLERLPGDETVRGVL